MSSALDSVYLSPAQVGQFTPLSNYPAYIVSAYTGYAGRLSLDEINKLPKEEQEQWLNLFVSEIIYYTVNRNPILMRLSIHLQHADIKDHHLVIAYASAFTFQRDAHQKVEKALTNPNIKWTSKKIRDTIGTLFSHVFRYPDPDLLADHLRHRPKEIVYEISKTSTPEYIAKHPLSALTRALDVTPRVAITKSQKSFMILDDTAPSSMNFIAASSDAYGGVPGRVAAAAHIIQLPQYLQCLLAESSPDVFALAKEESQKEYAAYHEKRRLERAKATTTSV